MFKLLSFFWVPTIFWQKLSQFYRNFLFSNVFCKFVHQEQKSNHCGSFFLLSVTLDAFIYSRKKVFRIFTNFFSKLKKVRCCPNKLLDKNDDKKVAKKRKKKFLAKNSAAHARVARRRRRRRRCIQTFCCSSQREGFSLRHIWRKKWGIERKRLSAG